MKLNLWFVSLLLFGAALAFTVAPSFADAAQPMAAPGFSWGQVCVIAGVAAAWGDLRQKVNDHHERIKELEKGRK